MAHLKNLSADQLLEMLRQREQQCANLEAELITMSEKEGKESQNHERELATLEDKLREALTDRDALDNKVQSLVDELQTEEERAAEYQRELQLVAQTQAAAAPPQDLYSTSANGTVSDAAAMIEIEQLKAQLAAAHQEIEASKATVQNLKLQRDQDQVQYKGQVTQLQSKAATLAAELEKSRRSAAREKTRLQDELDDARDHGSASLNNTLKRLTSARFKLDVGLAVPQGNSPMPSARGSRRQLLSAEDLEEAPSSRRRGRGSLEDDEGELNRVQSALAQIVELEQARADEQAKDEPPLEEDDEEPVRVTTGPAAATGDAKASSMSSTGLSLGLGMTEAQQTTGDGLGLTANPKDDEIPELEPHNATTATLAQTNATLNQTNRHHGRRFVKAMERMGFREEPGVSHIRIKKSAELILGVRNPEVYRFPGSTTFVAFGEVYFDDPVSNARRAAAAVTKQMPKKARASDTITITPPQDDDDPVLPDAGGLDDKEINVVMTQANVSRGEAVAALRKHNGDVVDSIMELTM